MVCGVLYFVQSEILIKPSANPHITTHKLNKKLNFILLCGERFIVPVVFEILIKIVKKVTNKKS